MDVINFKATQPNPTTAGLSRALGTHGPCVGRTTILRFDLAESVTETCLNSELSCFAVNL